MMSPSCSSPSRSSLVAPTVVRALSGAALGRAAAIICQQWAVIFAAVALSIWAQSWLVTLPVLLIVATRQHALLVLMHDGAHRLLAGNRFSNDLLSNLALSFPLFVSTSRYREHHLRHHRNVNRANDPDLEESTIPATQRGLLLLLARDATLLTVLKSLRSLDRFGMAGMFRRNSGVPAREKYAFCAFATVLIGTLTTSGGWSLFVLYWLTPMLVLLPPLLRIRGVSEHAGRLGRGLLGHARSIDVSLAERLILAPCNVNRHLEHHLFPGIPSYNLETLSTALRAHPLFASQAPITRGYFWGARSVRGELYCADHTAGDAAS